MRLPALLSPLALVVTAAALGAAPPPADAGRPTIFIAGDSTAAPNNGEPIQGWGVPFPAFFDPARVNVVNAARGGRSSRTFITEGLWDGLLAQVRAGDIVLLQFGHNDGGAINDEPPPPLRARGSLPGIGEETREIDNVLTRRHEVVHTFGWYLRRMVGDVKARHATPIVLSTTVRNLWHDGRVERGPGHFREWDREVARAEQVAFVDVTRIVADAFQEMGEKGVQAFFPGDHTHTNPAGAEFNAAQVVAGLRGLKPSPVEGWLSAKGREVGPDLWGWLNLREPANPALPSLVLIGDSTVRNGGGVGDGGQWGWGHCLGDWFDPAKINVVNRAVGGLSSRTFLTQGHWARALTLLKPGDWVLMQFGHNDNGPLNDKSRARGTLKGAGDETEAIDNQLTGRHEIVHTYGWYLRQYIREARARGVTPVVCTLVPRKIWRDGHIVRDDDSYAGWARQVAAEEGVAVIDLNRLVAERYDQLGPGKVDALFADPHTHTSLEGAKLNASIVAGVLRELAGHPLERFFAGRPPAAANR